MNFRSSLIREYIFDEYVLFESKERLSFMQI